MLDNGVISSEFWRIVDCPDDLSWALFFYAGAASVAGQAYTGAVLTTPDGEWPEASQQVGCPLVNFSLSPISLLPCRSCCCS